MTRFQLLSLLVLLPACGAQIEQSDTSTPRDETPAGETSTGETSTGKPKGGETNGGASSESVVGPLVRIKNTSSKPRYLVVDTQSTPVDFKIGEPPMQLNGYGSHWCGGAEWSHNEPFVRVVRIEPGETAPLYWRAIWVTREGDCWKGHAFIPATYTLQACSYASDPDGDIHTPGDKATTTPLDCPIATLTVPASGEAILELPEP